MDCNRQHGQARYYHTMTSLQNGQVLVAEWDKRRTIRSGDWSLDSDGQPDHLPYPTHGNAATERAGAGGRGLRRRFRLNQRGIIRSGNWGLDGNRQYELRA